MATKPLLAVGCMPGGLVYPALHKFDSAGNPYPHGHRVILPDAGQTYGIVGIALDAAGYVYCTPQNNYYADPQRTLPTLIKYNVHGDVQWTANHGAACFDVAVDDDGNVYTFGDAINSYGQTRETPTTGTFVTTRKYSPAGALLWSSDHGFAPPMEQNDAHAIAYRAGYLYTGTRTWPYTGPALTKTDATTGEVIWQTHVGSSSVYGIAVDADDNVYVAGTYSLAGVTQSLCKYDSDGVLIGSAAAPLNDEGLRRQGLKLVFHSDGHLIVATNPVSVSGTTYILYEYDTDCQYLARYAPTGMDWLIRGLAIDADDALYVIQQLPATLGSGLARRTVAKLVDFAVDWQAVTFGANTADERGNEVGAYSLALALVETPPLRLPLALGIPSITGDQYIHAPGLPLALALGVPLILREYVGPPLPESWRLVFPAEPLLSLALRSVQIRHQDATIALTLVVPLPDPAAITALEGLLGDAMEVWRGVRFLDATEQMESMLSVTLETVTADLGTTSASATLTGSGASVVGQVKTRALRGISYRNLRDGLRRVRCAVDTYLRPGDTADLGGGETMVVREITLFADPTTATMEVVE